MSRLRTRLLGSAVLAGAGLAALAGTAQAATPDLVPDLAPVLSAPTGIDPAPAPTAPSVEPSQTYYDAPLNQQLDFAPAGVPIAGLIKSVAGAPTRLLPS